MIRCPWCGALDRASSDGTINAFTRLLPGAPPLTDCCKKPVTVTIGDGKITIERYDETKETK